jgi:hypothetical protein
MNTLAKVLGREPVKREEALRAEVAQLRMELEYERSRGFLSRLFGLQPRQSSGQYSTISRTPWIIGAAVLLGGALVLVALWVLGFLPKFEGSA